MRTGFIVKLVLAMLLLVALMPKSCAASLMDWVPIGVRLGTAQVMLPHRHALPSPSSTTSWLIHQTFEGVGYDNGETWTTNGSGAITLNPDNGTNVIEGLQSLAIENSPSEQINSAFPAAYDEVWYYCMVKIADVGHSPVFIADKQAFTIEARFNAGAPRQFELITPDGTARPVTQYAANTVYHVWLHYRKGTGANSFASLGFSTTGIEPTSGNQYVEIINGTSTSTLSGVMLTCNSAVLLIIDKVIASTNQIGDNPP